MSKNNTLQLKVDLTGDHIDWFKEIKNEYNFQTYAEVIRFCIYSTRKQEMGDQLVNIELDRAQVRLIEKLLHSPHIKEQFNIYNTRQFVEVAIAELIDKIRDSSATVLDWDIKASLSGQEKEIALAFGKCYNRSDTKGISISDLAEELGWRDESKIESILDTFVDQFLLKSSMFDDTKIYHL